MNAYAKITDVRSKKQKMKKTSIKNPRHISIASRYGVIAMVSIFSMSVLVAGFSIVNADQYDQKIKQLEQQNDVKEVEQAQLGSEADSLSDAISKLQAEIDAKQATINQYQKEVEQLRKEIDAAEIELVKQKGLLKETIKAIYIEGDITTLEMLASSDDLTDFFDKQQYRDTVQDKVKSTLDKITQLKLDLSTKKEKTEKLIAEQKRQKEEISSKKGEKNRLLSLNVNEQQKLDAEIKANKAKMMELRSQQLAANQRLINSGSIRILPGNNGNDSYPNSWRNVLQDSVLDSWGMWNRECVSYVAWKVYESGRYMPYWGGRGNAHLWDDNARNGWRLPAPIPVDGNPRVGDVAVGTGSGFGPIGHVMYVEAVYGNGKIRVSQYNFGVAGQYSEMEISSAGLQFIHF